MVQYEYMVYRVKGALTKPVKAKRGTRYITYKNELKIGHTYILHTEAGRDYFYVDRLLNMRECG